MSKLSETIEPRKVDEAKKLQVSNLEGGYGQVQIINGIDLQLKDQEIISIIGPNGSGKSTFIKLIYSLATKYRGDVLYDSQSIFDKRTDELVNMGISYVPQVENIFRDLTVLENLEMGSFINDDTFEEDIERVFDIFPELEDRQYSLGGNLSGGQRQMLALGRALMTKPSLLLLDEPTAALSPLFVKQILEKIVDLREHGMTILLVEQNARSALKNSDYGYVFANGQVVYHAEAEELVNADLGKLFLGVHD